MIMSALNNIGINLTAYMQKRKEERDGKNEREKKFYKKQNRIRKTKRKKRIES